jgi:hypothetical protein
VELSKTSAKFINLAGRQSVMRKQRLAAVDPSFVPVIGWNSGDGIQGMAFRPKRCPIALGIMYPLEAVWQPASSRSDSLCSIGVPGTPAKLPICQLAP